MSKRKERPPIPSPAIDGFLEVTIGAMQSGMSLREQSREILDVIQDHEEKLIPRELKRDPENQQREEAAQYHLGQIAAINALIDEEPKKRAGFFLTEE
ncbi:hypothetical protein COU91_00445 [Candidatus Saccharibacteria bacterium CG10_big_fil_rev_8_21_14_0_10_47_8]|nr:MAG: hypothetical protein COU91_00445 [Candidatus Saccharibacteria bacterium CG10_big_fil_rev_8_21_14_0_10_47_8]